MGNLWAGICQLFSKVFTSINRTRWFTICKYMWSMYSGKDSGRADCVRIFIWVPNLWEVFRKEQRTVRWSAADQYTDVGTRSSTGDWRGWTGFPYVSSLHRMKFSSVINITTRKFCVATDCVARLYFSFCHYHSFILLYVCIDYI